MLKRVAAQCGDVPCRETRPTRYLQELLEPALGLYLVLAIAASLTASYAETPECKPFARDCRGT